MTLVVGVGVPTLDRIVRVQGMPEPDSTMLVESGGTFGGGQVPTALVAVARLGLDAALVAGVGDDPDGRVVVDELARLGVSTDCVRTAAGGRTAASVILVEPDGSRSILYDTGRDAEPRFGEAERALIGRADGLALAGTRGFTREALAVESRPEAVVLLDLDSFDEDDPELFAACGVVIASSGYAVSRGLEPADAARRLRSLGTDVAVVTCGAAGAVGVDEHGEHAEPAHAVEVVDTTGAGDVYHGAFLVAALERRPLAGAMRFASVTAALKCRAQGGRAGIPSRGEVDAALA